MNCTLKAIALAPGYEHARLHRKAGGVPSGIPLFPPVRIGRPDSRDYSLTDRDTAPLIAASDRLSQRRPTE
jgi:hypothetical protein